MAQSCNAPWLIIIWCFVTLKTAAAEAAASVDGINLQMTAMIQDPANPTGSGKPFLTDSDMDEVEKDLDLAQEHIDACNDILRKRGEKLIALRKSAGKP